MSDACVPMALAIPSLSSQLDIYYLGFLYVQVQEAVKKI